ncbi:transposase [Rhizobium laguerreae]|nr:transposase [Rhizobium laguerreae]
MGWRRCYNDERPHGAIGNKGADPTDESGGATSPLRE